MPYGIGSGTFTSSAGGDLGGGRQYTRIRGPLLLGATPMGDLASTSASIGASVQAPHVVNMTSMRADMLISICSTAAHLSANNVSTASPTGLVYISQTTGAGNIIAAGSTVNVPVGLPGGANGVALLWDAAQKTLAIYDPGTSGWLWPHQLGSSGNGASITWSASSS